MREGGNACGGGISESTSMKEHLSVFFKKLQGERRREKAENDRERVVVGRILITEAAPGPVTQSESLYADTA
jgi:hypothetical protein